jgi:hypothetical protein
MKLWGKKGKKFEQVDRVVYLFPQQEEIGPTIMMSKERGLAEAIAEAAKKLEEENVTRDNELRFRAGDP